jgi:tRNA threonylcarbamoyl adenosine modification protein (Sua5/YciO/YrdC/YwlC family)
MSEVFDCTTPEGLAAGVEAAAKAVQSGQVVVLPTDTVYGIGCDAFDAAAVSAVLAAKGRGRDMPPPVLVPNARTVDGLARSVPAYARHLVDRFWPGALTLVLEAQPSLTWDLGETNGTVALRMPDHEIALALLGQAGPMAVTSANLTGQPAAQSVAEAQEQLGASVAVYLDGGPAPGGYASTILDCTGEAPVTLREGALTRTEVDQELEAAARRDAAEAARKAAVEAAAAAPPRGRTGPKIAGSRRRK